MLQPSRQPIPVESVDPDPKAFLDDYVGRLHRATALDDDVLAGISATRALWLRTREQGGRVIFIGNGGSSGIASHLAIDLSKNAAVPALCFSDASMMSCLANDYGFDDWIAHAVRLNACAGDCLVAISSSGRSKNILNAVAQARTMKLDVITLSGMSADNPLRDLGDVNFFVDSRSYNIVETTHQFWMMAAIDLVIGRAEYPAS
ncbi:SIS domain-containing protein [Bradyrhizobium sp. WSM1743]|uniref:SIS domain-containing protein n=1 Tax=Bradyrhizobium sp. WSM1743 TaxID=318996 RepID=UPI000407474D|nr:SIS domain-containing protein [Bradyrhizobium sp. WSM1743]